MRTNWDIYTAAWTQLLRESKSYSKIYTPKYFYLTKQETKSKPQRSSVSPFIKNVKSVNLFQSFRIGSSWNYIIEQKNIYSWYATCISLCKCGLHVVKTVLKKSAMHHRLNLMKWHKNKLLRSNTTQICHCFIFILGMKKVQTFAPFMGSYLIQNHIPSSL